MPTLLLQDGFKFFFYANEHEPKHIHVAKGDEFAKIELATLRVVNNRMKPQYLRKVLTIVEKTKKTLRENGMNTSVRGKAVHFDDCYLHVELEDERIISTPMSWYEELQKASLLQLQKYKFICHGTGIEWPDIDYHLSIESMLLVHVQKKAA